MEDTKMPSLENALKALLTSYGFTDIKTVPMWQGYELHSTTKAYRVMAVVMELNQ